jgi:phage-related protein (TIGR01555 family)
VAKHPKIIKASDQAIAALREIALGKNDVDAARKIIAERPADFAGNIANAGRLKNGGLASAIGYPGLNQFGFPSSLYGSPNTVENATTIFENLRYYLVSNFRQILSQAFVEFGLVQRICMVPVQDGLRGGIELKSKQLGEANLQEIQDGLERDDDLNIAGEAETWNRLFGGGGIIVLTDQNPAEPFYLEDMKQGDKLEFRAVDMWELFWDKQNSQGYDPSTQTTNFTHYNYYDVKLHKSRVMRLKGLTAPSFIRPRLRGWGFSVVETLVRSINQYLKATSLGFEVLDEFKLDIYRIKNLNASLLSAEGEREIFQRVQMGNWQKNFQNALVMDVEDEYDHKQLSFAGLAEAMEGIRMQVACDMRMPMTRLFGQSAAGFNSGEDDLEVYNSMVESEVRNKLKYNILRMCEIKCMQHFGFVPDDLSLNFMPMRVLTAEQEQNVKTQKFTRLQQSLAVGAISLQEFRTAANRSELFDITLDEDIDADNTLGVETDEDDVDENEHEPSRVKDIDDPGANRVDSQKSKAMDEYGVAKGGGSPNEERAKNSAAYDRASYEAEGGDMLMQTERLSFFDVPLDKDLWKRAEAASKASYGGGINRKFCIWWYQKQGGKW